MKVVNNPRVLLTEEERDLLFRASELLCDIFVADGDAFKLESSQDNESIVSDMNCSLASTVCCLLSRDETWNIIK